MTTMRAEFVALLLSETTRAAGEHARGLHDELVAFSASHPGGADRREDEMWSFVAMKEKNRDGGDPADADRRDSGKG